MENLLMALTVALSAGRNIISKDIGRLSNGRRDFFLGQTFLFSGGALVTFLLNPVKALSFSPALLIYAFIYGVFLVSSQWLYTISLKSGSVSVCSLVYSFGFIIPTVSGALVWKEPFGVTKYIGVACAIVTVLLSAKTDGNTQKGKKYFIPLIAAMISSGGLGVMQKVQQKSDLKPQANAFLFLAFALAFLVSFSAFCLTKGDKVQNNGIKFKGISASAGLCFGGANYLNTILAGMMESSVFFPLQNIATVVLSAVLGILIFKEKLTLKKSISFAFGIITIFILKM